MSVAEQTASEKIPRSPSVQLAGESFAGALFVLVSLWLVFGGLPTLWGEIFPPTLVNEFLAGALLILASLVALLILFFVGMRLEKGREVRGLRPGIALAAVMLFVISWIALAFGNWMATRDLGIGIEVGITIALALGLLFGAFKLFVSVGFYNFLIALDEQGWFHSAGFKPNQGFKVRRATMIGVLTLGLCGIISLVNQGTLGSTRLGANDWYWTIPFTGSATLGFDVENSAAGAKVVVVRPDENATKDVQVGDLIEHIKAGEKERPVRTVENVEEFLQTTKTQPVTLTVRREGQSTTVSGRVVAMHRVLPLLYRINVTVPLFLSVVLIWFAWRVVNWPVFADFLIATEAEMNKVSWTTRKRLFQDTIVVLVTVFILTTFLFAIDILWIKLLGNPLIRVLQVDVRAEQMKQQEKTQW